MKQVCLIDDYVQKPIKKRLIFDKKFQLSLKLGHGHFAESMLFRQQASHLPSFCLLISLSTDE
jgi:hypothetical protein